MNYHREFEIAWQGLKNGFHELKFDVDDKVLSELGYDHPDFENLKAVVDLKFEKESSFFLLQFNIDGTADVACDRCGDFFPLQLWDEYKLIIKLTDSEEKADEMNEHEESDVVFIPRSETVINVFEWIFEYIMLSIPIQKIHPDMADGQSGCNPEALNLLKKMSAADGDHKTEDIWKGLDKFRNNISDN